MKLFVCYVFTVWTKLTVDFCNRKEYMNELRKLGCGQVSEESQEFKAWGSLFVREHVEGTGNKERNKHITNTWGDGTDSNFK